MQHHDFCNLFQRNEELVSKCETYEQFVKECTEADRMRNYLLSFVGGWADRSFLTYKLHGFTNKPLHMPQATKLEDLFEYSVILKTEENYKSIKRQYDTPNSGLCYIGSLSGFTHSGPTKAEHYIRLKKGTNECFTFGIRKYNRCSTYVKPRAETLKVLKETLVIWGDGISFEFIKQSYSDRVLVTGNDRIGSRWLTYISVSEAQRIIDFSDKRNVGELTGKLGLDPVTDIADASVCHEYAARCEAVRSIVDPVTNLVDLDKARALNVPVLAG